MTPHFHQALFASTLAAASLSAATAMAEPSSSAQDEAVYAQGADPLSATPVQQEQAQARFTRGKDHFEAGEFEAALDEFTASFAIVASPNARLYQSRCLLRLGRKVQAYAEYGRTMVQALELGKREVRYQRTAEAATEERKQLEQELAFVRATIHRPSPLTRLIVNGEEIRRTAWGEPVPVTAGVVEIELITPNRPTQHERIELEPGTNRELTLDVGDAPAAAPIPGADPGPEAPRRNEQSHNSLLPYAYLSAGVGVVGVGSFVVLGTMSKNDYTTLQDRCIDGNCPPSEATVIERGRREQTWANVGLAVGAAGLGTAVTLWLLDGPSEEQPSRIGVRLAPNGATVWGQL
jgi:tetratricopeptide (TPR) repeat protein